MIQCSVSCQIIKNRIIIAICKQITFNHTIRINKSSPSRMIISASQIVHPGFFIVDIPTIAERVELAQAIGLDASAADGAPPCIIFVFYNNRITTVNNGYNVALQILHITVGAAVVYHHRWLVLRIIEEMQLVAALGHRFM